jgi:hypothetical protein
MQVDIHCRRGQKQYASPVINVAEFAWLPNQLTSLGAISLLSERQERQLHLVNALFQRLVPTIATSLCPRSCDDKSTVLQSSNRIASIKARSSSKAPRIKGAPITRQPTIKERLAASTFRTSRGNITKAALT